MSQIALSPNPAGTGTFTIEAPNSNTNRTLTLPDSAGTIALQGGAGVGKVLQVVQASTTGVVSTTSQSMADTGLSGSIAPTSANSKILVIVSQLLVIARGSNAYNAIQLDLLRGASVIFGAGRALLLNAGVSGNGFWELGGRFNLTYLDSPNTTSPVTYKTQFSIEQTANSSGASAQPQNLPSTITLIEIAA